MRLLTDSTILHPDNTSEIPIFNNVAQTKLPVNVSKEFSTPAKIGTVEPLHFYRSLVRLKPGQRLTIGPVTALFSDTSSQPVPPDDLRFYFSASHGVSTETSVVTFMDEVNVWTQNTSESEIDYLIDVEVNSATVSYDVIDLSVSFELGIY